MWCVGTSFIPQNAQINILHSLFLFFITASNLLILNILHYSRTDFIYNCVNFILNHLYIIIVLLPYSLFLHFVV